MLRGDDQSEALDFSDRDGNHLQRQRRPAAGGIDWLVRMRRGRGRQLTVWSDSDGISLRTVSADIVGGGWNIASGGSMATTMASRTPSSRRSPPSASPSSSPPSGTKTVPSRSAASSRGPSSLNASVTRRQSLKATSPLVNINGELRETRESLSIALKLETEKREQVPSHLLCLGIRLHRHCLFSSCCNCRTRTRLLGPSRQKMPLFPQLWVRRRPG